MSYPCLKIYLDKISYNSEIINSRCADIGISVVGVTKCVLGDIKIAEAMRKSGIVIFGDSRLENLKKLRNFYGEDQKLMMLRSPMPGEVEDLPGICDVSLNTQLKTLEIIEKTCLKKKIKHRIIVMVETDDRREGLLPDEVVNFCKKTIDNFKSIELYGLGTNARCVTKNGPDPESLKMLVDLREDVMKLTGINMPVISGGNSSVWNLIEEGSIPEGINQVRIGEAILLGHDTVNYRTIKDAFTDSFILEAEIIEVKKRNDDVCIVILALGLQDVSSKNIHCRSGYLSILNQSSDHTILSVKKEKLKECGENALNLEAGGIISFNLDYFGLLSCMTSPFIKRDYIEG
ncbi:MAG: alanine racemase [Actinomycetota bacterium]|nr:alanine racemase [Actinomycetota bacterium]